MDRNQTFSREYLQGARALYLETLRNQAVATHINQNAHMVVEAARQGRTQYMVSVAESGEVRVNGDYVLTTDDLLEGYRAKFPGCRVEYGETWEPAPRNPNQMNKKSGILIDWS